MIQYLKRGMQIAELHHNETGEIPTGVDVVRFRSRPEKVRGTCMYPFHTIAMDLDCDPEQLLGRMHKSTRNQVRQAIRLNHIEFDLNMTPDAVFAEEFLEFFDRFALQKKLPGANRERILGMRASGALVLSRVAAAEGVPLVWHCYVRCGNWVRLLHSASLLHEVDKSQAGLISRANRYHHWLDMSRLRELGIELYDFGGWYSGKEDAEKLRINVFKESFGGRIVQQYNTDHGVSWKGMLAARARFALNRWRGDA